MSIIIKFWEKNAFHLKVPIVEIYFDKRVQIRSGGFSKIDKQGGLRLTAP